jgi:hypothetical protein
MQGGYPLKKVLSLILVLLLVFALLAFLVPSSVPMAVAESNLPAYPPVKLQNLDAEPYFVTAEEDFSLN